MVVKSVILSTANQKNMFVIKKAYSFKEALFEAICETHLRYVQLYIENKIELSYSFKKQLLIYNLENNL